uniref:Uncharacterized protein n=1 Tax=Arundo donax TaxID=35708 RepID=A0A0A9BBX6_ARUDO
MDLRGSAKQGLNSVVLLYIPHCFSSPFVFEAIVSFIFFPMRIRLLHHLRWSITARDRTHDLSMVGDEELSCWWMRWPITSLVPPISPHATLWLGGPPG